MRKRVHQATLGRSRTGSLVRHLLFLSAIKLAVLFGLWLAFFRAPIEVTGEAVGEALLHQNGPGIFLLIEGK